MLIGLCFAEICSAFPQNGSVYYWSSCLSRPQHQKAVSYLVGAVYFVSGIIGSVAGVLQMSYLISFMIWIFNGNMVEFIIFRILF
jgi:amino acid transporter